MIAGAGMVAQSVLKQFDRIVWRFRLDDGNARIVVVGGNAGVTDCVSGHRCSGLLAISWRESVSPMPICNYCARLPTLSDKTDI
jgi:hypothetical protein